MRLPRGTAPRTMILLDPALAPESPLGRRPVRGDADAGPAPKTTAARRTAEPAGAQNSIHFRLPSARALARFLGEAQSAVHLRGQVTVLLTTDAALHRLNRRFRGKNKPTDVLSFPANPLQIAKPAERVAGDVAISVETARRQSAACGHSLATEIKVLILHGLLHLAGYDHEIDAGRMALREQILRARFRLPQGLIERAVRTSRAKAKRP